MYFQIAIIIFTTGVLVTGQDFLRVNKKEKHLTKRHIYDIFNRNPIFQNDYPYQAPNHPYVYQIPPLEYATPIQYFDYTGNDFEPTADGSYEEDFNTPEDTIYAINPYLIFNLENCKDWASGGSHNCNIGLDSKPTVINENIPFEDSLAPETPQDIPENNQTWPPEPSTQFDFEDETNTNVTSEASEDTDVEEKPADNSRPEKPVNEDEETPNATIDPDILNNEKPVNEDEETPNATTDPDMLNNENLKPMAPIETEGKNEASTESNEIGDVENNVVENEDDEGSKNNVLVPSSLGEETDNAGNKDADVSNLLLNKGDSKEESDDSKLQTSINNIYTTSTTENTLLYTSPARDNKSNEHQDTLHKLPTSTNIDDIDLTLDQLNAMLDMLQKKTNYSDENIPKTKPNEDTFDFDSFPKVFGPSSVNKPANKINKNSSSKNKYNERNNSPVQVIRNLLARVKQGFANVVVNSFAPRRVPQGTTSINGYRNAPPRYFPKFERTGVPQEGGTLVQDLPKNKAIVIPTKQ